MKATITSFRRNRHTIKPTHMILEVPDTDSIEKAEKLVGKQVIWKSPAGKEIKGKIAAPHGNKGCVRAIFETGMPGQALGTKVEVN